MVGCGTDGQRSVGVERDEVGVARTFGSDEGFISFPNQAKAAFVSGSEQRDELLTSEVGVVAH